MNSLDLSNEDLLLLQELHNRKSKTNAKAFDLKRLLTKRQYEVLMDPSRYKVFCCSRRSGKTMILAFALINECLSNSQSTAVYIGLDKGTARSIIWRTLKSILTANKIKATTNETNLSISFPNGSQILIAGTQNESEVDKLRGLSLQLVVIDEAQSHREYIRRLITEVIQPALLDSRGQMIVAGTPGYVMSGYFFDLCHDKDNGFAKFSWTIKENTFILNEWIQKEPEITAIAKTKKKPVQEIAYDYILASIRRENNLMESSPIYKREYLGEWVASSKDDLVYYGYDPIRNSYPSDELPERDYNFVIAVDPSGGKLSRDNDALVCMAYSADSNEMFLVEEMEGKFSIEELATIIIDWNAKYHAVEITGDFASVGDKIVDELNVRYGIPITKPAKAQKMTYITLANNDFEKGLIKFPIYNENEISATGQSLMTLAWDQNRSSPGKMEILMSTHQDLTDAFLYAYRGLRAYGMTDKPWIPKTIAELNQKRESELEEQDIRNYKAQYQDEDEDFGFGLDDDLGFGF